MAVKAGTRSKGREGGERGRKQGGKQEDGGAGVLCQHPRLRDANRFPVKGEGKY